MGFTGSAAGGVMKPSIDKTQKREEEEEEQEEEGEEEGEEEQGGA